MTIEEKAIAYDKAINAIKKLIENYPTAHVIKDWIKENFPELVESKDERIRKELIFYFQEEIPQCSIQEHADKMKEFIAWLEKQGKQISKHFELKAGHWYICHRAYCCGADSLTIKEGERFICEKDGVVKGFVVKEPEKYFKEVCAPAHMEDE